MTYPNSNPSDSEGVPGGFEDELIRLRLRSMVDRLSKAATRYDRGEVAAAWIAVGRVENELRKLADG
jgi:hypothetical protein